MVDRLSDPKKKFHGSMLDNAEELADMLGHVNYTNDARLTSMAVALKGQLLGHEAKELRSNPVVRKAVAEDAKRMLNTMKGYGLGS